MKKSVCLLAGGLVASASAITFNGIENGSFEGGDPFDETKRVWLTEPYYIGLFELTQKQWSLMTGETPKGGYGIGDKLPVCKVSCYQVRGGTSDGINWPDTGMAVASGSFLGKLRAKTGLGLDLPTESCLGFRLCLPLPTP